jgi:hypothetical protein
MQNRTESSARDVTIDDKRLVKIRQLKNRSCCQDLLQCRERRRCFWGPNKGIFFQELSKGARDAAVVTNEFAIVAGQPQKTSKRLWCSLRWPCLYSFHLGRVHGHAPDRYNMAQVRHTPTAEDTLALFDR